MPDPTADVWHWRVHYRDGATFDEFDADGHDHGFAEVDGKRLAAVELLPNRPGLPNHIVLIDTPAGQRAIFFRRRVHYLPLGADGEPSGPQTHMTATVLGWQRTIKGRNVAHFSAYFDDGSSFMTDDRATLDARIQLIASLQV